jgi:SAM-dependent methyltransferase
MGQELLWLLLVFLVGIIGLGLYGIWTILWRVVPILRGGAPYVPTSADNVRRMIAFAELRPTDRIVDLGSGDGQIVFAAVQAGAAHGTGYELDPGLLRSSVHKAERLGLADRMTFERRDFWTVDLSAFDVIFLFQIPYAMPRLESKIRRECKPGTRIVSNGFKFPAWELHNRDGTVYFYVR